MSVGRRRFVAAVGAAGGALLAGCAGTGERKAGRASSVRTVNLHAHWYPQEWVTLIEREGTKNGVKVGKNDRGYTTMAVPGFSQVFRPERVDLGVRLRMMDDAGVDVHALSLTSPMVYWASPDYGLRLSQAYNDACSAAHLKYPERFYGLAMLPMQDPRLALEELNRAAKLPGLRGVYMGTNVNGRNLDEKSFFPIYARCEELGWHVGLHPNFPVGGERTRDYYMRNFLGNPYDTGIAASTLIFGGVMDAFPRLDVVLPHAGGAFPGLIGRLDHGTTVRPEVKHMKRPPSSYLRRFHYDTIAHNSVILMNLIRQVGVERIVLGDDFDADMGYERPVEIVERLAELTRAERDMILGTNGARLLKIGA